MAGVAIERVGIIGAGAAAAVHLRALQRLPGKRVVGVLDTYPGRAAALADKFGLRRSMTDPNRLYEELRPQLVHVVTPPHAHQDVALEALSRGVHVLVEKPPALTVAGCRILLDQANRGAVTIGVNENTALDPLVLKACRAIAEGRIGRLVHIDGFYSFGIGVSERPPQWMDWLPGAMLEDLLPHPLTVARALAGQRLTPEYWHLGSTGGVVGQEHDEVRLLLTADHGLTVNLTVSLTARPKAFSFVVRGAQGQLTIDLRDMLFCLSPAGAGGMIARGAALLRASVGALCQTIANIAGLLARKRERYGSSLHLIRAHYAALEMGREVPAPLSRAIETIEIIRRIWPAPSHSG